MAGTVNGHFASLYDLTSIRRPASPSWLPPWWRIFTDPPVDGLAKQVCVTGVPAVLLDQIAQEPAQAGVSTVGRAHVDELVGTTACQSCSEPSARACNGVVPESVELLWSVVGGRDEFGIVLTTPLNLVPRLAHRLPGQLRREDLVLDSRQVLEQATECQL